MVKFRHSGIVVQSISRQLTFYKDILGLEVYYDQLESGSFIESILGIAAIEGKIVKLGQDGQIIVELLKFNKSDKEQKETATLISYGYTHVALSVDNLNKLHEVMIKKDVKLISAPTLNPAGTHLVCFCRDFEGNFIELVEEING